MLLVLFLNQPAWLADIVCRVRLIANQESLTSLQASLLLKVPKRLVFCHGENDYEVENIAGTTICRSLLYPYKSLLGQGMPPG